MRIWALLFLPAYHPGVGTGAVMLLATAPAQQLLHDESGSAPRQAWHRCGFVRTDSMPLVSLVTPTESLLAGQQVLPGEGSEAAVRSWVFPDTQCLADTHGLCDRGLG